MIVFLGVKKLGILKKNCQTYQRLVGREFSMTCPDTERAGMLFSKEVFFVMRFSSSFPQSHLLHILQILCQMSRDLVLLCEEHCCLDLSLDRSLGVPSRERNLW